jgi:broad specificity phosphatase PhoE
MRPVFNAGRSRSAAMGRHEPTSMDDKLPEIYIARHGETAWTITGQHTGMTDLPLTPRGEKNARRLGKRLREIEFAKVLTSPLQRARKTCEQAGFGSAAEVESDLVEWDYGEYEGLRSAEIRAKRPGWELFRDGAPGGESPAQVVTRADTCGNACGTSTETC